MSPQGMVAVEKLLYCGLILRVNEGVNLLSPSRLLPYNINIERCKFIINIVALYTLFVKG